MEFGMKMKCGREKLGLSKTALRYPLLSKSDLFDFHTKTTIVCAIFRNTNTRLEKPVGVEFKKDEVTGAIFCEYLFFTMLVQLLNQQNVVTLLMSANIGTLFDPSISNWRITRKLVFSFVHDIVLNREASGIFEPSPRLERTWIGILTVIRVFEGFPSFFALKQGILGGILNFFQRKSWGCEIKFQLNLSKRFYAINV